MSVLSPALLGAVALVLLASGLGHLLDTAALRRGLDAHGVLPPRARRPVARLLGPAETVLGGVLAKAAVDGPPLGLALVVSLPAAVFFTALALYLRAVLRATAGRVVPCACGLGEAPVSPSTVLRAAVLVVLSTVGGATAVGWSPSAAPAPEIFVALASAVVIAVSTALLPAARALPDSRLRQGPRPGHGSGSDHPLPT